MNASHITPALHGLHKIYCSCPAPPSPILSLSLWCGFMTAITGAVSVESALNAVLDSVPKGTEETNAAAFNKGCDYGSAVLKGQEKKATGKTGA